MGAFGTTHRCRLTPINKEQHSDEILALYDPNHPRPFTDKIRLLKAYFNKHPALAEFKERIRSFASAATCLSKERNEYIHGIVEGYDENSQTIILHGIKPKFDRTNSYLFSITLSAIPLNTMKGFADIVNRVNDQLETISRVLFSTDAIARLRKRE